MTDPTLDVVIVSYRSRELLARCLRSLAEHPAPGGMTVTVVDNASGDGTDEYLRREHPEVISLPQSENLGFGAATNIGIRRGSSPYVLALNPDAAVEARHARRAARADGARPADRLCGLCAVSGGRRLRPRGAARLPDAAQLARPLHRRRPPGRVGPARRLPGAGGRQRSGRRRQRRLHAAPPPSPRAGRPLRRGLLDVHGGPRPQLAPRPRRLDHLVRADRARDPHEGRNDRRAAFARSSTSPSTAAWVASTASTTPPGTPELFNAFIYAGIGVKLATSLVGGALRS